MRELRELVRHRAKLVALRSGLKAQVHAVLAKQGLLVPVSDLFGVGGRELLARLALPAPYRARVNALGRLIDAFDFEIDAVSGPLRAGWPATPATARSRRCPGSARCWPRCSSPRSATSTGSPGQTSCAGGPG